MAEVTDLPVPLSLKPGTLYFITAFWLTHDRPGPIKGDGVGLTAGWTVVQTVGQMEVEAISLQ